MAAAIALTCGCGGDGSEHDSVQWLALQREIQQERTEVGHQRDLLEADRREWNEQERGDHLLASIITSSVLVLCCALPLVAVVLLLWPQTNEPASTTENQVLLAEVIAQSQPRGPRITGRS